MKACFCDTLTVVEKEGNPPRVHSELVDGVEKEGNPPFLCLLSALDLGYLQGLKTAMKILRTHGHPLPDIASIKLLGLIQALEHDIKGSK